MTNVKPCREERVTERPRYFAGQLLGADDFESEQDYLLDRIRSHNRLHGWGTVCGLEVEPTDPPSGQVVVQPGVALDCCGREIVVTAPTALDVTGSGEGKARGVRFVMLAYGEERVAPAPVATPEPTEPVEAARVREVPVVAVARRAPAGHEPSSDGPGVTPCPECDEPSLVIARIDLPRRGPVTEARIDNSVRRAVSVDHQPQPRRRKRRAGRWGRRILTVAAGATAMAAGLYRFARRSRDTASSQ